MRIVIIGAGAVGSYLAERLSSEGQDVVVVESDGSRATEVQGAIDCLVIHGNGASPSVLEEAGLKRADLLIAVTSSDAVNVLAAHAGARFGVPRRVARVEDPQLLDEADALGVDLLIDPGETTAAELVLLVRQGGVSEVIEFADGRLDLIGGYISDEAPVTGLSLSELKDRVTGWTWVVVAIIRNGATLVGRGSTQLQSGDHVLIMAETEKASEAFELLGWTDQPARSVVILGATRLAKLTARKMVAEGVHTVLIDQDADRIRTIAEEMPDVICVLGDPTDARLLRSEGVGKADAVLALTGWDEVNILGCLVGKALGAGMTVARFHRVDLVKMLPGVGIDGGVSSRLTAASEILRFVRKGHIHSVTTFQDSEAEAIELQVGETSSAMGRTLADLNLPRSVIIGGIIRGSAAFVPRGDTVVQVGDRLIVIALPSGRSAVEKLSD
ncbi:MAG: Trk system potassium transporter TrkA [Acidimicrobiia bacterium]